ncbi:hypothetical protein SAMN04487967_1949 [Natronorubrum sediminis]|uniref:Uncharacterized protein n=1 Tax=Natronorubrum sediminis TaxID=640943 RepID=A0A1H6FZH8_9EURY|nr:hypothetical protein SAMN04487967_1949 [Natronorubrum sediminis]
MFRFIHSCKRRLEGASHDERAFPVRKRAFPVAICDPSEDGSNPLENRRDSLPEADAHGRKRSVLSRSLEFVS